MQRRLRSTTLATALTGAVALGMAAVPGTASAQPEIGSGTTAGTIEVLYGPNAENAGQLLRIRGAG